MYREELEAIKSQLRPLRGERMELLQASYPPHQYKQQLFYQCVSPIHELICTWGKEMIPYDIRRGIDKVYNAVNLPLEDWPIDMDLPSHILELITVDMMVAEV